MSTRVQRECASLSRLWKDENTSPGMYTRCIVEFIGRGRP